MANNRNGAPRRRGSQIYQTNGAAAYDIYRLPNREMESGNAARRLKKPAPRHRARPKPRPKAKLTLAPLSVMGLLAAACMLVFVLCGYVQLFEETAQVSELQAQLRDAQAYQERLEATYDSKIDLDVIQEQAEALGMTLPNSRQTVYLNLEGVDRAVISEGGTENVAQTAWEAIRRSIHTLMEYFG